MLYPVIILLKTVVHLIPIADSVEYYYFLYWLYKIDVTTTLAKHLFDVSYITLLRQPGQIAPTLKPKIAQPLFDTVKYFRFSSFIR